MKLIQNDLAKCVGCNHCIRVCPIEGANVSSLENGRNIVSINPENCIHCGACLKICEHGSRYYVDDTESFFADLKLGERIAVIIAPAAKTNLSFNYRRFITLLRKMGVDVIYDVSLGADICTWAHIRYIQEHDPACVITQPCPVIVNYITKYQTDLLPHLSPVHSPMMCTAIFMQKYKNIKSKIAAISPCVAKKDEFEETEAITYNVTFHLLEEYLIKSNIELPEEEGDFDNIAASLGQIYPMPGGLKENIAYYLGDTIRVDKCEGQYIVYQKLDELAKQPKSILPEVFDVLNCEDGCNLGTGSKVNTNYFKNNKIMSDIKRQAAERAKSLKAYKLFDLFDKHLSVENFLRTYQIKPAAQISITEADIEDAFLKMGKDTPEKRSFNCSACGAQSCYAMAVSIAKGYNVPENCIEKAKNDLELMHSITDQKYKENIGISNDMLDVVTKVSSETEAFKPFLEELQNSGKRLELITKQIDKIIMQLNLLSLNATIEAARAGKAGVAFSVVAEEISKLSKDTECQIKDTAQIIDGSTRLSEITARFITQIADSMNELSKNAVRLQETINV